MAESSSHLIILTNPDKQDPILLAKAMAAIRKTPLQDQMMAAKNGWGIVAENLSEDDSKTLVQNLQQTGIGSAAIQKSAWVPLPEAKAVTTIDATPYQDLILIAAGAFTVTSTTTKTVKEGPTAAQTVLNTAILLGTGLPIKIGGKTKTFQKTTTHSDVTFCADLIYQNPLRRVHIEADTFNYAFLKERKLYQVLGNFKLLLGDFVKRAPHAWKSRGTQVLLANQPVNTIGYGSVRDQEREMQWLLTLHTLKI